MDLVFHNRKAEYFRYSGIYSGQRLSSRLMRVPRRYDRLWRSGYRNWYCSSSFGDDRVMQRFASGRRNQICWMARAVCCAFLTFSVGCQKAPGEAAKAAPVSPAKTTYPVSEATLNTIELTEDAVRRLGIETQPIEERSMPRFRT